jgi:hypothetical protein
VDELLSQADQTMYLFKAAHYKESEEQSRLQLAEK